MFQSPSPHKQPYKQAAHFEVAEDPFVEAPAASKKPEKPAQAGIANTDSGYHGISGDEMDTEPATQTSEIEPLKSHSPGLTRNNMDENVRNGTSGLSPDYRSTAKSFRYGHGALSGKIDRLKLQLHGNTATKVGQDGETSTPLQPASTLDQSTSATLPDTVEKKTGIISHPDKESMLDDTRTIDDVRSASEGSSPVRALVRKSSLTFAALPARAPLAIKKSIDARHSRTSHLEQFAMAATSRGSYFDSHTEGKSLGGLQPRQRAEEANDDEEMNDNEEGLDLRQTNAPVVDVTMTELHHKSSTQRLHEKINKLGRSNSVVNHGSSPKQSTTPVGSPRRTQKEDQVIASPFITEANTGDVEMADAAPVMAPPPSRNQRQISQTQKTREFCRPVKPSREVAAKPKPKPVAIRVGTLSQRVPLSNATLSSTLQESLPPSIPKQPMAPRKDLPQPTQGSSSNTGFKSSVSSTISKPKGLLAAERKKLQVNE